MFAEVGLELDLLPSNPTFVKRQLEKEPPHMQKCHEVLKVTKTRVNLDECLEREKKKKKPRLSQFYV